MEDATDTVEGARVGLPLWLEPPPGGDRLAEAMDALCRVEGRDSRLPPTAQDAFDLGRSMAEASDAAVANRGRCWLWVSAALGCRGAAAELCRHIVESGQNGGSHVDAPVLFSLASSWLRMAAAPAPAPASRPGNLPPRKSSLASPAFEDAPDMDVWGDTFTGTEASFQEEVPAGSLVAVHTLGDPASKEGREIAKRFAHFIGVPLPFRGTLPHPADLERDFLARFPWAGMLACYLRGHFSLLAASGRTHPSLPRLLLVGPTGCGKTTMLEWLADYCGRPFQTLPVSGTSDSAGLVATSRNWTTGQASVPVQLLADTACANPCLILDELDKGVSDMGNRNGSVAGALLPMLQPPRDGYRDSYLMAAADLSGVGFLASANSLATIAPPLRMRFNVHRVPRPGPEHFDTLLEQIIPAEAARLGVNPVMMPWITPGDRAWLRKAYEAGRGDIRNLVQAYLLLVGHLAAENELAMRRPH